MPSKSAKKRARTRKGGIKSALRAYARALNDMHRNRHVYGGVTRLVDAFGNARLHHAPTITVESLTPSEVVYLATKLGWDSALYAYEEWCSYGQPTPADGVAFWRAGGTIWVHIPEKVRKSYGAAVSSHRQAEPEHPPYTAWTV